MTGGGRSSGGGKCCPAATKIAMLMVTVVHDKSWKEDASLPAARLAESRVPAACTRVWRAPRTAWKLDQVLRRSIGARMDALEAQTGPCIRIWWTVRTPAARARSRVPGVHQNHPLQLKIPTPRKAQSNCTSRPPRRPCASSARTQALDLRLTSQPAR